MEDDDRAHGRRVPVHREADEVDPARATPAVLIPQVPGELVGALAGLGRVLNMAQQDIYPAMVMVGMAAVGVLGWLTTRLLAEVEHRAMPWLAS